MFYQREGGIKRWVVLFFVISLVFSLEPSWSWAQDKTRPSADLSALVQKVQDRLSVVRIKQTTILPQVEEGKPVYIEQGQTERIVNAFLFSQDKQMYAVLDSTPFDSFLSGGRATQTLDSIEVLLQGQFASATLVGIHRLHHLAFLQVAAPESVILSDLSFSKTALQWGERLWALQRGTNLEPNYPVILSDSRIASIFKEEGVTDYGLYSSAFSIIVNTSAEPLGIALSANNFPYLDLHGQTVLVSVEDLLQLLKETLATPLHVWTGLNSSDSDEEAITPEVAQTFSIPDKKKGVLILSLPVNTPLYQLGIRPGDILKAVGDVDLGKAKDPVKALDSLPGVTVGKKIFVRYYQRTAKQGYEGQSGLIIAMAKPLQTWLGTDPGDLALLTEDLAKEFGFSEFQKGLLVLDVYPGSPLDQAGIHYGDILTQIGPLNLHSGNVAGRQNLLEALQPGQAYPVTYLHKEKGQPYQEKNTTLTPEKNRVPAWLGVDITGFQRIDADLANTLGLDSSSQGTLLLESDPQYFPARPGDILLQVGSIDFRTKSEGELSQTLQKLSQLDPERAFLIQYLNPQQSGAQVLTQNYETQTNEYIPKRRQEHPWLGVTYSDLSFIPDYLARLKKLDLAKKGLVVKKDPDKYSIFDKAGIKKGDILYEVQGISLVTKTDSEARIRFGYLSSLSLDTPITIQYLQREKSKEEEKSTKEEQEELPKFQDKQAEVKPVIETQARKSWLGLLNPDSLEVVPLNTLSFYEGIPQGKEEGVRLVDFPLVGSFLSAISPKDILLKVGNTDLTKGSKQDILDRLKGLQNLPLGTTLYVEYLKSLGPKYKDTFITPTIGPEPDRIPWLGFMENSFEDLPQELATALDIPKDKRGVRITNLSYNSPLLAYGLQVGDIIVKLGGIDCTSQSAAEVLRNLIEMQKNLTVGEDLSIEYLTQKDGKYVDKTLKAKVSEVPPSFRQSTTYTEPAMGLVLMPVTWDIIVGMRLNKETPGLFVRSLSSKLGEGLISGVAGGRHPPTIVTKIGENADSLKPITSLEEFIYLMDSFRKKKVTDLMIETIEGAGDTVTHTLHPDWDQS